MDNEITTSEAAKILAVMPRQARWYFEKGLLPGRLIAGRLVFPREAVEKFVKPKKTGRPAGTEKTTGSASRKASRPRKPAPDAATGPAAPEPKSAKGRRGRKGGKPS